MESLPDFAHMSEMEAYFAMKHILDHSPIRRQLVDDIVDYSVRFNVLLLMRRDRVIRMMRATAECVFLIVAKQQENLCDTTIFQYRQEVLKRWEKHVRDLTEMEMDVSPKNKLI